MSPSQTPSQPPHLPLSDKQIQRYSRQIILEEIGSHGMMQLLRGRVCIIGAGGLGCPVTQILASVGVGFLRIIDPDLVELSNLPRQYLHFTADVGQPKVISLKEKLLQMNPEIEVEAIQDYVTQTNIAQYIQDCHYVIDASDNFATKYLINDACVYHGIPFTIAGAVQYFGQIMSVIPGETACYRCLFREEGVDDPSQNCSGLGVMNTVPTLGGILEAQEAIHYLLGRSPNFLNKIMLYNLAHGEFNTVPFQQLPDCPVCRSQDSPFYQTHEYHSSTEVCSTQK